MDIYQISLPRALWDISNMTKAAKREEAANRARALHDRLMAIPRPDDLSNNEWAKRAGVNTSFFTNLRNGSEPSIGNLRAVLSVVGTTIPEFFSNELRYQNEGSLSRAQLEAAFRAALPGMPKNRDRQAEYLVEVAAGVLGLQQRPTTNVVPVRFLWKGDEQKDETSRETTRPTGS